MARIWYPEIQFEAPTSSPEVIVANQTQIGLQNLKAKYDQSDRSEDSLRTLVKDHFSFALRSDHSPVTFEEAQKQLRPQIMPPEYAEKISIVSFPFGKTLAIGLVLNQETAYAYLKTEDAVRWGKSSRELLDLALANLDEASRRMPMQATDNAEVKFVGIETKDGFDAARILIPKFQGFMAGRLGSPFHFGIPNRDFLICWNTEASAKFVQFTRAKLLKDFETQPYPLSPNVFSLEADGTIAEE